MLSLDHSRAYCFPNELIMLVEAVLSADPADESRSVEWKKTLDLTITDQLTHLPHTLLGFANRDPAEAAREFRGYAYLIVGAEPGNKLLGVVPMDPSDLVAKVKGYVGDVIVWHPSYVTIRGEQVLVIAVEPPRPGDDIHPLHKAFRNYVPGTIFTREPGRTVIAGVERLNMLQRRLRARGDRIELTVYPNPAAIETAPTVKGLLDSWCDRERERLAPDLTEGDYLLRRGANADRAKSGVGLFINPELLKMANQTMDPRSLEEYEQEVERYLTSGRRALAAQARKRIYLHGPTALRLRAANGTDRHFRRVQLTAIVENASALDGRALDAVAQAAVVPRSPAGWGEGWRLRNMLPDGLVMLPRAPAVVRPADPNDYWEYSVTTTPGQVEIAFRQFDLRTRETWTSPPVPLMTELSANSQLGVSWHATADDAEGRLEGAFVLDVTESTLDLTTPSEADDEPE